MPRFTNVELSGHITPIFEAAGASVDEARIVTHHLIDANLAGVDSHGVMRVPQYLKAMQIGQIKLGVQPKITQELTSTAVLDGNNTFGQVACNAAMAVAIKKAHRCGISAVTVHNSYHSGCIASYTKKAAAEGFISLVMVNAGGGGQSVAPFGGLARRLATNPLSIAAPSLNGYPIVLDIATSVAPEGKIRNCYLKGESIPHGWIVDAFNRPTTNPKDFYDGGGALLPLGGSAGYKGFGLAFMIDILAGALSGAGCCRANIPEPKDGLLIIAINIERFIPMKAYYQHVSLLVEHVKSCPPASGHKQVYIPGELEFLEERKRRREGIELDTATWREIEKAAVEVGLPFNLGVKVSRPALSAVAAN